MPLTIREAKREGLTEFGGVAKVEVDFHGND
jgi:hypothetical protein